MALSTGLRSPDSCCLRDDTVEYDVFHGVSDNSTR